MPLLFNLNAVLVSRNDSPPCLQQLSRVFSTDWPWNEGMNEIRIHVTSVKNQDKTVLEITQQFATVSLNLCNNSDPASVFNNTSLWIQQMLMHDKHV